MLDNALHILSASGISDLVYVGGAPRMHVAMHARHVPDLSDIEPCALRGVLTALHHASVGAEGSHAVDAVMMLACDVPLVAPQTVQQLMHALEDGDAAVAMGNREHWSCLALRTDAHARILSAYQRGVRALHMICDDLTLVRVSVDEHELTNANDQATYSRLITKLTSDHE